MMNIGALLVVAVVAASSSHAFLVKSKSGMLKDPHVEGSIPVPPAQWFQQTLDHFDTQVLTTWKQRFFVNSTFYKPGGPVFLQIGGEGTANPVWVVVGQMMVQAQAQNAMAILVEHRYYGDSHPTPDLSLSNMRYLSSEQALADLANFRDQYGSANNLSESKWVTFGGSYPGSLSAWARVKYPHFFHAAVASSAPVWSVLNFTQYLEVVQNSIGTDGGPDCLSAVQDSMKQVNEMLATASGRTQLKVNFNACSPITSDEMEIATFAQSVAGLFMGVVQYNRDNVAFEGRTEVTISDVCEVMTNKSINVPVDKLVAVSKLLNAKNGQSGECFDSAYTDMVSSLKNSSYGSQEGGRQWMYQVCHEFGFLQSSQANSSAQPFGNLFPVGTQVQLCEDVFGVNASGLANYIRWSNQNYGSLHLKGSRIVFPNGNIDPWHALSVLPDTIDLGTNVVPVLIDGTAHCANMYPSREDDLPSLVAARETIANLVLLYIQDDN
ncbi:putative serine protease K12H4.7 [Sycon ciliatum]|uniref:putative serine protease K12H4.7 n=1 Tax=Sycon ciliatum TaxID=27933 RepID=UPI0031F66FBF|eukprot:scpid61994/ scgid5563/ Putative serine protease K12H4.7